MSNGDGYIKVDKFELNLKGLNELMRSPEMSRILYREAFKVSQAAKAVSALRFPKYKARVFRGKYISIVNLSAANKKTNNDNFNNNTLLKALGQAKGFSSGGGSSSGGDGE